MKKKRVIAGFILAFLMVIPSVISIETYNEPGEVTIKIPDAISSPEIIIEFGNEGTEPVSDIAVFGEIQKILGVVIIGDVFSASISSISPGETVTLQTQLQFGIGLMNYNVSVSWGNCTVEYDRNYLLIGILIIPL